MYDAKLASSFALLGVSPGCTVEALERAFMNKNFALIREAKDSSESIEAQRAQLRTAYEQLLAHLKGEQTRANATPHTSAVAGKAPVETSAAPTHFAASEAPALHEKDEFALFAFDHRLVNLVMPPLLLGIAWLATIGPMQFLLKGFHVWMHEFGHATAAWMTGRKATPLPFGWTPVEGEFSWFVYFGVLFLFGVFFVAGWKERKLWPMIAAVILAGLQFYMTWRLPAHEQEFWWGAFGGVGGEFYLSTLLMMAFFVQLPEKFRWGACRYVFFLIGATAFLNAWMQWRNVHSGAEEIPFGSMINGEDDANGDMNKLMDDHGWTMVNIRQRFYVLGLWCWAALGATYITFALKFNKAADWVVGKLTQA